MAGADEITTGEISRGLIAIREDIKGLAEKMNTLPDWQDVRRVEAGLDQRILAERETRTLQRETSDKAIKALEDANTWIIRTSAGALLTAIAGTVFAVTFK